jgi:hypothetical protein
VRRTQLYLDDDLWKLVHTRAKQSGVTISELVREALRERYCEARVSRQVAFENVIGLWKDRSDLGETEDYVRALRRGTRLKRFVR